MYVSERGSQQALVSLRNGGHAAEACSAKGSSRVLSFVHGRMLLHGGTRGSTLDPPDWPGALLRQ